MEALRVAPGNRIHPCHRCFLELGRAQADHPIQNDGRPVAGGVVLRRSIEMPVVDERGAARTARADVGLQRIEGVRHPGAARRRSEPPMEFRVRGLGVFGGQEPPAPIVLEERGILGSKLRDDRADLLPLRGDIDRPEQVEPAAPRGDARRAVGRSVVLEQERIGGVDLQIEHLARRLRRSRLDHGDTTEVGPVVELLGEDEESPIVGDGERVSEKTTPRRLGEPAHQRDGPTVEKRPDRRINDSDVPMVGPPQFPPETAGAVTEQLHEEAAHRRTPATGRTGGLECLRRTVEIGGVAVPDVRANPSRPVGPTEPDPVEMAGI